MTITNTNLARQVGQLQIEQVEKSTYPGSSLARSSGNDETDMNA
jgi:hypothetical protein